MVNLNINIQKKDLWLLSAIVVFMVGVGFVVAWDSDSPILHGHTANEIQGGGSGGDVQTSGMYVGWGDDECAPGYSELYQGWMYQGGQNNGYGGDIICSKSERGTFYIRNQNTYVWELAPPCVVCSRDADVGECYTNFGDASCASGFNQKYSGKVIAAGQGSGKWKTSLVCADSSKTDVYRYSFGYKWEESPDCSVCCNDAEGGIFTNWGQHGTVAAPSCPEGYSMMYEGMMFQSGQRSGYGANAVCGASIAAHNEVYIRDKSYQWTTVPCSVCSKVNNVGNCFTAWGDEDLSSVPSGYSKIYSGNMYSAGVNHGDGGGLVCSKNLKTDVYVHDGSYKWGQYPCSLYCSDTAGGQYTSWGSNSCASGYTNLYSGLMYQAGINDGMGGELKCAKNRKTELYIRDGSAAWVDSPSCAVCAKSSSKGLCYDIWGSQKCASGFSATHKGNLFQGGVRGGYGQGTVCSSDKFLPVHYLHERSIASTTDSYKWVSGMPCASCCSIE